jgi:hypothetical protein
VPTQAEDFAHLSGLESSDQANSSDLSKMGDEGQDSCEHVREYHPSRMAADP